MRTNEENVGIYCVSRDVDMIFCGEKLKRRKIVENGQKFPILIDQRIRTPNKVWGSSKNTIKASFPFVKYIVFKIYIQIHHVKKIIKEYFKEQINYNYFIIKYKNFF